MGEAHCTHRPGNPLGFPALLGARESKKAIWYACLASRPFLGFNFRVSYRHQQ